MAEENRKTAVAIKQYLKALNKTILTTNIYSDYSNVSRLEIDDS